MTVRAPGIPARARLQRTPTPMSTSFFLPAHATASPAAKSGNDSGLRASIHQCGPDPGNRRDRPSRSIPQRIHRPAAPPVVWLEAHSENYFAEDGIARGALRRIRRNYPLSLHGVGLSIGSTDPLDKEHLGRLRALVESIEPALVSEHLSWGAVGGRHLNDLLPLPYTEEALEHMVRRVHEVQDTLKRPILIENVSS